MIFELHGKDADSILLPDLPIGKYKQMPPAWHNSWFSPPTSLSNINEMTNIRLAQMPAPIRSDRIKRRPHLGGNWPLTHEERIKELEAILLDELWQVQLDDIKAAINYHKELDGKAICKWGSVSFYNGRRPEGGEYPPGQPTWIEVSNLA
jgi:hypothetical protein